MYVCVSSKQWSLSAVNYHMGVMWMSYYIMEQQPFCFWAVCGALGAIEIEGEK